MTGSGAGSPDRRCNVEDKTEKVLQILESAGSVSRKVEE